MPELKAEEQLRLAQLVECADDAIFSGDHEGVILTWNAACERLYGYSAAEAIGQTTRLLKHPEQFAETEDNLAALAHGQTVYRPDTVRYAKDGRAVPVSLKISPIVDDQGRVVGFASIARDLSEQKRLESEREELEARLLQAQKMESVGRLAGGIAHDFNNMLQAIHGHCELALLDLPEGEAREHLADVVSSAERAADLTRQLLAFGRRQPLSVRALDLNRVVDELEPMISRLIGEQIELLVVPAPEPLCVLADRSQLEQVVLNLVVNARDAIPEQGAVVLAAARQRLGHGELTSRFLEATDDDAGDYAVLSVADTGSGMDEETVRRAFEPFFTTKGVGEGTGLGLSTVYGIVRQSGGFTEIDSLPGRGTRVSVYLPLETGSAQGESPAAPEAKEAFAASGPR